jgi:fructan beta-fructosidase
MRNKFCCFISFLVILGMVLSGCSVNNNYYKEKYRPLYHYTPKENWMNDPNGMVYFDGEYHLSYQHDNYDKVFSNMSWGHAISTDLVHWKEYPKAIVPDNDGLGMIFSGSAVVDKNNCAGFGVNTLIAFYTSTEPMQQQCMAYSTDKGRSWTKYSGNPVLKNTGSRDFRDPKVFWHDGTKKWIMILAVGDKVEFYNSSDLKNWNYLSSFGSYEGSHGGVWECPEMFMLPVDGDKENMKWLLKVDLGDNAIGGGSGGQYFIGNFDGNKFTNENSKSTTLWIDYGADFYASQSWSGTAEAGGDYYWLGWMNNWKYGQLIPTKPWKGAMSIPRKIGLRSFADGVRLVQSPVSQLESLRYDSKKISNKVISPDKNILKGYSGENYEIVAEFELGTAEEFGFKLRKSESEETTLAYDTKKKIISVNRANSGVVNFHEIFKRKFSAELKPVDNKIKMHIFIDSSSIEVFGNDGEVVMTNLIFPDPKSKGIELYSKGGDVKLVNMEFHKLSSSWKKKR